jgi:hypothetical protein
MADLLERKVLETQAREVSPPPKRGPLLLIASVVGLVVVLGVLFALRLVGKGEMRREFVGTLQPDASITEALTFVASSVHGRSGVMSVELNEKENKVIVRFSDVGPNSAACALMRDSFHRRDILRDSMTTFDTGSCNG